jgi:hypothetical protein
MTWYLRSGVSIAPFVLVAACGGRSQLRDVGASSAGGGGSGGTTTSSATTASSGTTASASSGGGLGGGGGAPLNGCVLDGPPIGIAGTQGYAVSNPVLVAPGKSDLTTLVAGWTTTEGPKTPPSELRHTSFAAWGTWPADGTIGPSYLANYDGGQSFDAAPAASGFSVFLALPSSSEIDFMAPFTPGSGAAAGMASALPLAAEPAFLAQGKDPDIHLLGFSSSNQGIHDLRVVRLSDTMGNEQPSPVLGCAVDPIVADAVPVDDGFLIAFGGSGKVQDPACATGMGVGPARRLFVVHVGTNGDVTTKVNIPGTKAEGPIDVVKMVRVPGVAIVAWRHELGAGLELRRLNITDANYSGSTTIPFSGDASTISATAFGQSMALAWAPPPIDGLSNVHVQISGASGGQEPEPSFDFHVGPPVTGRTAILASPSGTGLLVAWSSAAPGGSEIQLARLGCSLP